MIPNFIFGVLLIVIVGLLILVLKRLAIVKNIGTDDLDALREDVSKSKQEIQSEVRASQDSTTNTLVVNIGELSKTLTVQIENMRAAVNEHLQVMQDSNEKKLDQMRQTVDEQLQTTLEKRLRESFGAVSENLEAVQQGLGKMQNLAADVGNLQRVLTSVNVYGTWAEVQLGAILEQILTSDQYGQNVQPHTGSEKVEYAVRLPGNDGNENKYIWLPIDSKFPMAFLDAAERADKEAEKSAIQALRGRVESEAKKISQKYISLPHTTEFAIMFLPTEGLYAEVLRQPGLVEELIQDHKIVVAGPTNLAAILFGFSEGFRTLAIQEHASEIKNLLAAVKTLFGKYHNSLELTQKQLKFASNNLEDAGKTSREVVDKLSKVEALPPRKNISGYHTAQRAARVPPLRGLEWWCRFQGRCI
ncbi:DNA recombination protein RmuC [Candidatus Poribacteria bacterium]|nr:DNA recombination protein RmuC [Candidatus Poribacteria bacterium]MYB01735.1 DNA recombination protein RmuC [Candidatus Poribacteria bacterium]